AVRRRDAIDQDGSAVAGKHKIILRPRDDALEPVLESGATTARDADPEHRPWRLGLENLANSPCRPLRQFYRTCHRFPLPVCVFDSYVQAGIQSTADRCQDGKNVAVSASRMRAPFAADPAASRGRLHPHPPTPTPTHF